MDLCSDHRNRWYQDELERVCVFRWARLQGKNNRRTQRLLLRVRPVHPETDIMVTVRSTGRPQAGCAVYDRDIENENSPCSDKPIGEVASHSKAASQNPIVLA